MVETSVKFRISVWRDFNPKRTVVGHSLNNQERELMFPDNLQEEVYSWQTSEDPFGGVADVLQETSSVAIYSIAWSRPGRRRNVG